MKNQRYKIRFGHTKALLLKKKDHILTEIPVLGNLTHMLLHWFERNFIEVLSLNRCHVTFLNESLIYSLVLWIIYSHAMFYIFRSALGERDIPWHEIFEEEQLIFVFRTRGEDWRASNRVKTAPGCFNIALFNPNKPASN